MPRSATLAFPLMLISTVCAAAGGVTGESFDARALPAAFADMQESGDPSLISELRRRLPADMSVVSHGHLLIAARETAHASRRIVAYDAEIRRRQFPHLEARRTLVVLGDDASMLEPLAKTFYPNIVASQIPAFGFYHPEDRLIVSTTADGDAALLHVFMRALVLDDNPDPPHWFLESMATLYASHDESAGRLTPALDASMDLIAPDEDLGHDVFAGICDCAALTAGQQALIRLLLVYLDERGRLADFHAAVREQGRYTTLLQALDAMNLDRDAWKTFAERRVGAWWRSRGEAS